MVAVNDRSESAHDGGIGAVVVVVAAIVVEPVAARGAGRGVVDDVVAGIVVGAGTTVVGGAVPDATVVSAEKPVVVVVTPPWLRVCNRVPPPPRGATKATVLNRAAVTAMAPDVAAIRRRHRIRSALARTTARSSAGERVGLSSPLSWSLSAHDKGHLPQVGSE